MGAGAAGSEATVRPPPLDQVAMLMFVRQQLLDGDALAVRGFTL
jgi:hypothetical protein